MPQTPNAQPRFQTMVFADGASSGNPGPGGWGAIVATLDGRVIELGGADPETTNNRMELMAAIEGLGLLCSGRAGTDAAAGGISVYTDSVYVIKGITAWIWGWMKRGWKNGEGQEVANPDLWKRLFNVVQELKKQGVTVDWKYVRGHSGIPGNERVDEIAVSFSKGRPAQLYRGPLLGYGVAIHDIPENTEVPERKGPAQAPKAAAYSYLSLVNGVPMRHRTWPECEGRVKGRPGAKFKKAVSETDEKEILASWGYGLHHLK